MSGWHRLSHVLLVPTQLPTQQQRHLSAAEKEEHWKKNLDR